MKPAPIRKLDMDYMRWAGPLKKEGFVVTKIREGKGKE